MQEEYEKFKDLGEETLTLVEKHKKKPAPISLPLTITTICSIIKTGMHTTRASYKDPDRNFQKRTGFCSKTGKAMNVVPYIAQGEVYDEYHDNEEAFTEEYKNTIVRVLKNEFKTIFPEMQHD